MSCFTSVPSLLLLPLHLYHPCLHRHLRLNLPLRDSPWHKFSPSIFFYHFHISFLPVYLSSIFPPTPSCYPFASALTQCPSSTYFPFLHFHHCHSFSASVSQVLHIQGSLLLSCIPSSSLFWSSSHVLSLSSFSCLAVLDIAFHEPFIHN